MSLTANSYLANIQIPYWQELLEEKLLISPLTERQTTVQTVGDLASLTDWPAAKLCRYLEALAAIESQIAETGHLNLAAPRTKPVLNCSVNFAAKSHIDAGNYFDIETIDLLGFIAEHRHDTIYLIVKNRRQGRSAGLYLWEEDCTKIRYVLDKNVAIK